MAGGGGFAVMESPVPYCGAAPEPWELASRWNLDPWVIGALAGLAAYALARRRNPFLGGAWLLLAVIFVSPFCALTSALFSARVVHHALLVAVVAPLLAFGLPRWKTPPLAVATGLHFAVLWAWHAPGAYAWALAGDGAYWLMQASLLGSALAFWAAVRSAPPLAAAAGLAGTMMQTGLLGALITFAGSPLYAPHFGVTAPWGLTALEDQQVGGLIMWAPMAGAYLLAVLVLTGRGLFPAPRRAAA